MNKIIFHWQKGRRVAINLIFVSLFSLMSFHSNEMIDKNDYAILNLIIKKYSGLDKTVFLNIENNNEYVVSIINQLNQLEKKGNKSKLDSLKNDLGITNTKKFNAIFNKNEYPFLISQKQKSKWDLSKIIARNVSFYIEKEAKVNQKVIYLSKPVYNKNNNFALVYYSRGTSSGIIIYENINKKWIEYKLINPMFSQPKVTIKA